MNDAGNKRAVTLLAETDAAIGGFAATNVAFAGGAASGIALLTKSTTTNCILKESFELVWKAVVSNETEIVTNTLGKTDGHVFYTILDEPKLPWTDSEIANTNVWVSALEFVITNACEGKTTKHTALSAIPTFLFSSNSLTYDTTNGRAHFIVGSSFDLTRYISPNGGNRLVNCYDQAHGVAFLGATLASIPRFRSWIPLDISTPFPSLASASATTPSSLLRTLRFGTNTAMRTIPTVNTSFGIASFYAEDSFSMPAPVLKSAQTHSPRMFQPWWMYPRQTSKSKFTTTTRHGRRH